MEKLMKKLYEKIIRFFTTQRVSSTVKIEYVYILTEKEQKRIKQFFRHEIKKYNQKKRKSFNGILPPPPPPPRPYQTKSS